MGIDISAAYEGVAEAWATGAGRLYDGLAQAIVDEYPLPLQGRRILDLGAGTGAVSRTLLQRGAEPVAIDSAHDMVAHCNTHGIPATVGDLLALPLPDASFDGAIAAFSISHVRDPVRALREAGRVVAAGGTVVAAVFAAASNHRSKAVIEAMAATFGYSPPQWYVHLKRDLEPLTNTSSALRRCAMAAGLAEVSVVERTPEVGLETPEEIVASRLGMAHIAPFVAGLPSSRRDALMAAAVAAVAEDPQPLRPAMLIMRGKALISDVESHTRSAWPLAGSLHLLKSD
ncbi:MAG: class I SAM-dependent methyltransferase [Candidatus Dormibacteria bacterium]